MKIRIKLFLIILLPVLATGIATAVVSQKFAKYMAETEMCNHLLTTAESRASHVRTFLNGATEAIKQLSESIVIEQLLLIDRDNPDYSRKYDDVTRRLKNTLKKGKYVYGVFVLDKNGTIIASSEEIDIGKDKSDDPYFIGGKEGVFIKDAYTSRNRKIDSIAFSAPVFDEKGVVFLGVVVMRISIEELNKITTDRTGLGETCEIFLLNKDGYMITPSRFLNNTFLKQKVGTFHSGSKPEKYVTGYEHEVLLCKSYRGVEVLRVHTHIPDMSWCLIAEIDEKEAFASVSKLRSTMLIMLGIFIAMAITLSILLSRAIIAPILKLRHGAEKIAAGDLDFKIATKKADEIGELSRSFDRMTSKLKKSGKELQSYSERLERIVEKKTGELDKKIAETEQQRLAIMNIALDLDNMNEKLGSEIAEREAAQKELSKANKKLQDTVNRANQLAIEAQAANTAKSVFLANMSHEIRTPMNGVIGMTDLLLDTELTSEQLEYANTIKKSGNSLLTIINDILDFSKIEAGKFELETLDFDLRMTLEDMTVVLAVRAYEKGLEMTCLIEPDVPALLQGDPGRLRQIITNLIGNSIKFTAQGEVALHVTLDNEANGMVTIRFAVKDTGCGMPADKLDILFNPFTQADFSTTRKFGGTGLGLSISKQLCKMMGGQIGVESKEGKGSTFWFTACLNKQPHGREMKIAMLDDVSLKGLRILAVDDNATNRRVVAGMLSSWECRHEEVADARTALDRLRAIAASGDPFRIAILDMVMPEIDGETLGRMIKDDPALRDTVLVMMTSIGVRGDANRFEKAGFAVYLTKPVKQSQLFNCLMTAIGRKPSDQALPDKIITRHTVAEKSKQKICILLAEDNLINQKVALRVLEKLGYQADVVANGLEALKALELIHYDLVLMDVQMPEMDGLEATREIRKREKLIAQKKDTGSSNELSDLSFQHSARSKHIPIIAMTAHAMEGDREMCLKAGMDDYLTKPIQPGKFAKTIARWISDNVAAEQDRTEGKPSEKASVFDKTALLNRIGGDEDICQEIIGIFLQDMPGQIEFLENTINKNNPALVDRQAHTLRGASGNVGAVSLQDAAMHLEEAGKKGDLSRAAEMLNTIKKEFEKVKKAMTKETT